jgi:hypothetical protein
MSKKQSSRCANANDVKSGRAVFFISEGRSEPYPLALPTLATVTKGIDLENGEFLKPGTRIKIIQAEVVDGEDVLLGFEHDRVWGLCFLQDVTLDVSGCPHEI